METAHLEEFVHLAESLSFRQTAEHFFVNKSVISRHLAALEEEVGAKLVERSGRTVSLTDEGQVFYRDARAILRDCASAVDHVRAVRQTNAGLVRVGYLRNAARPIIVNFVQYMHHRHPGVRITLANMEYSELKRSFEDGGIDIALTINASPDMVRRYRSTSIYTDRFFAVMGKDSPFALKAGATGIRLSELPDDQLIIPDSFAYAGVSELIAGLLASKAQKRARELYNDIDMMYLKVQTEGFIALASGMTCAMLGDSVAIVPIKGVDTAFTVSAFYRDGMGRSLHAMCRRGIESCQADIAKWAGGLDGAEYGFTFDRFQ